MPEDTSLNKVDAIYELREAAEKKAHAERDLDERPSPGARDALLEAQLTLEQKTGEAIDACHECGHQHESDAPHITRERKNVIHVNFGAGEGA